MQIENSECVSDLTVNMASESSYLCGYCGKKCDSVEDHDDHIKCHMETGAAAPKPPQATGIMAALAPPQPSSVTAALTPPQATSVTTVLTTPQATSVTAALTPPQATSGTVTTFPKSIKSFPCKGCNEVFHDKSMTHYETCQPPVYHCSLCSRRFNNLNERNLHLGTHGLEKMLKCLKCGKLFSDKDLYEGHMTTHAGDKIYHCSKCGVIFRRLHDLKSHVMKVHTTQSHKVPSSTQNSDTRRKTDKIVTTQIVVSKVDLQGTSPAMLTLHKTQKLHDKKSQVTTVDLASTGPQSVPTATQGGDTGSKTDTPDKAQTVIANADVAAYIPQFADCQVAQMQQLVPKHEDEKLECLKCLKLFSDKASYSSHLHFLCFLCGRLFGSMKETESHIAAMHLSVAPVQPTSTGTVLNAAGPGPTWTWPQTAGQSSQSEDKQYGAEKVNLGTDTPSIMQATEVIDSHRLTAINFTANENESSASELNQHEDIKTEKGPHICVLCGAEFDTWEAVNAHLQSHNVDKPHKCSVCTECFSTEHDLGLHTLTHEADKPHTCSVCNKRFLSSAAIKQHLQQHKMIHTGEKKHYKFYVCNKYCATPSCFKQHRKTHTGEKPHKCPLCGKQFIQLGNIKKHILRIHTGEIPYKCSVCNQECATSSHLKRHKMIHTGEKPYECPVCKKRFRRLAFLKIHTLTHEREQCLLCLDKFNSIRALVSHMEIHKPHMFRNHKCIKCDKCFSREDDLTKHTLTHETETRLDKNNVLNAPQSGPLSQIANKTTMSLYVCSVCQMVFLKPSELQQHMHNHGGGAAAMSSQANQDTAQKACQPNMEPAQKSQPVQELAQKSCSSPPQESDGYNPSHVAVSTGEAPYKCAQCGECFNTASGFDVHKLTHQTSYTCKMNQIANKTTMSVYVCSVCHVVFLKPSELQQHIKTHGAATAATSSQANHSNVYCP